MPDEEFDVLGEEDLALLSRWFERITQTGRTLGGSQACVTGAGSTDISSLSARKHGGQARAQAPFEDRPQALLKGHYKAKNKSEQRPWKSGGHKKKERAMVAGASDIDSSSCYTYSSSSDEEETCTGASG
jgi:hypothetical protein